jgi:predicted transcriptional regulator
MPVNQAVTPAELIAKYRRAEADAVHKLGLIKVVGPKGPKAIQAAVETAARAAKRRDSYARKLAELGVVFRD